MKARLDRIINPQPDPETSIPSTSSSITSSRPSQIRARSSVRTATDSRMSLVDTKKAQSAVKHYPKPRGLIPK
jgi:hypothetical protein